MKAVRFFLLCVLSLPSVSFAYGDAKRFFRLLESGEFNTASSLVGEISGDSSSGTAYLEAQVLFFQQEYERALEKLRAIPPTDSRATGLADFQELVMETHIRTKMMQELSTEHFSIRFVPGRDEVLPLYAASALESVYRQFGKDLGVFPKRKIVIEFYPTWKDFIAVSTLTEQEVRTTGTIALCKFNRMMVTTPRALLRGYAWLDTVAHEYVHYLLNRATSGLAPVWLHEGIAKYLETRWRDNAPPDLPREHQALLKRRVDAQTLISFQEMHPSIAKLKTAEDAAVAFAEVFYFIKYLTEVRGDMADLQSVLAKLQSGSQIHAAIGDQYGKPFDALYAEWTTWLDGQNFPDDPHASAEKIVLHDASGDEEARGNEELRQMADERARDLARIGDLLLHREQRPRAALHEYEKARRATSQNSVFLLNKIAIAADQAGNRPRALEALNEAGKLSESFPATFVRRGTIHLDMKEWDAAEQDFLQANHLNPFDPDIHAGLLRVYRKRNDEAGADRETRALKILHSTAGALP